MSVDLRDNLMKRIWHLVRPHAVEWIVGVVGAALLTLLTWCRDSWWPILTDSLLRHTAETLFLIACGGLIFFLIQWCNAKKVSKISLELASERSLKADDLQEKLFDKEKQLESLESENANLRKPTDPLALFQRQIVTCVLCADKITIHKLARSLGVEPSSVGEEIVKLRWTFQIIRSCGSSNSEELFELTDDGKQYAINQGIKAIRQSEEEIEQGRSIDAKIKVLEEQNGLLFQRLEAEKKRGVELENTLGQVRRLVEILAEEGHPKSTQSAFAAIRESQRAQRRQSIVSILMKLCSSKNPDIVKK